MRALQVDWHDTQAELLLPSMKAALAGTESTETEAAAIALLDEWTADPVAAAELAAPLVFQAWYRELAREVFEPVLWDCPEGWPGQRVQQVWFPGTHGDVGGQLSGYEAARPLANVSLQWMLEKAETCGLPLPDGWPARFP